MDQNIQHDDGTVEYRHCPRCGGRLRPRVVAVQDPVRPVCSDCGFVFYLDPKVAVGAICTSGEGIILLRRAIEPGHGRWVFPGGYVDRGETLEGAARREALEEVNAEIRIVRLVNAYSYEGLPIVLIVFAAEMVGGELRRGEEALEVRVFTSREIPWEDLAFQSTREALRDYLSGEERRG